MAYATGADLITRYDVDVVGVLATDDRSAPDRSAVPSHPAVSAALADASGEVDAALEAGGRYTSDQLSALTGNRLSHLVRITCAIAIAHLYERRAVDFPDQAEAAAKQARQHLEALRRGVNVFGIPEAQETGTIDIATVEAIDIENLNLLPARMGRYFPQTAQRTPRT